MVLVRPPDSVAPSLDVRRRIEALAVHSYFGPSPLGRGDDGGCALQAAVPSPTAAVPLAEPPAPEFAIDVLVFGATVSPGSWLIHSIATGSLPFFVSMTAKPSLSSPTPPLSSPLPPAVAADRSRPLR